MTAADLIFDAETHTSKTPDGRDVPHVTTVLSAVGVTADFDDLSRVHQRVAENIRAAAARGQAVHADCHAFDDDDLDWHSVDPRVAPFVEAWAEMREREQLVPVQRERRLYHPVWHYTGTMDGVFLHRRSGHRVLADIKTADPDDAAAHLQTAAYECAYVHDAPPEQRVDERWSVWLQPGLRTPYRIVNYTARPGAHLDLQKWLACLSVYYEQPGRRRRIA
jgi:hypothetical protein